MWHRRILDKFRNTRKRYDRELPAVKTVMMRKLDAASDSCPKKKRKNAWGLPNFFPAGLKKMMI